jgi:hypothetical protein
LLFLGISTKILLPEKQKRENRDNTTFYRITEGWFSFIRKNLVDQDKRILNG